jgi:periplasmic protein TonB
MSGVSLSRDEEATGVSSIPLRMWQVPIIVSLLFAGGVYWLRQIPDGARPPEQSASVQVHLVRTPDPAPIPLQANPEPNPSVSGDQRNPSAVEQDRGSRESAMLSPVAATPQAERPAVPDIRTAIAPVRSAPDIVAATFQRALLRHIERYQVYPVEARGERLQGLVQLVFAMGRDGRVLDAWVKQSSGSVVLDKAALDTVKRAQPLPRIPNELPDRLNVMIPVAFARS